MKVINLWGGKKSYVSDRDYSRVRRYSWGLDGNGKYASTKIRIDGKRRRVALHRYILGVTDPKVFVDHVDRNPLNNLRSNLRICSNSQNQANRLKKFARKAGRFKGVYWRPKKNAWVSEITHNKNRHYLGIFQSEIEAAKAYNQKAIELFGEFALLNRCDAETIKEVA